MTNSKGFVPVEVIQGKIVVVRDERIMLDRDLAELYGVETKQLKRAVRRNKDRFPPDFMFALAKKEVNDLRCHFGTSSWGGTRYAPIAFTEQGVAMLSSVLNSKRAIEVNILIMRAFVQLRKVISSQTELARKLEQLEKRMEEHDEQIVAIFEAIRQLMTPPDSPKKKIGFEIKEPKAPYRKKAVA
jgi:hypothetical protein